LPALNDLTELRAGVARDTQAELDAAKREANEKLEELASALLCMDEIEAAAAAAAAAAVAPE